MNNLIALKHQSQKTENILVVDWGVSNVCNFRCSYCPTRTHLGDFPFVAIDKILDFSKRINDHYKTKMGKDVYFLYTGGEVTLYKDFLFLIETQKKNGNKIGISTNGSRDLTFWSKAKYFLDNISISYHDEFTDLDHFIKVINTVKDTAFTHVNIMIRPGEVDKCIKAAYRVHDETDEVTIDLQIVLRDFKEPFEYTDDERKIVLDACSDINSKLKLKRERNTYRGLMKLEYDDGSSELIKAGDIVTRKMNSWKGWDCSIGLELMVIDINGDIFRSWCGQAEPIGNVNDEVIKFPNCPFTCPVDWCPGGITDIMVTKVKEQRN
jgi:MoaA/NifB/PqqE/SkfB family radical SAM enzyme